MFTFAKPKYSKPILRSSHTVPQVQYSLLYRTPERNGVMDACKEHNVTLVAYSPLCQGLLTGEGCAQQSFYQISEQRTMCGVMNAAS